MGSILQKIKNLFSDSPRTAEESLANSLRAEQKRIDWLLSEIIADLESEIRLSEGEGDFVAGVRWYRHTCNTPTIERLTRQLETIFQNRGYRTCASDEYFSVYWEPKEESK